VYDEGLGDYSNHIYRDEVWYRMDTKDIDTSSWEEVRESCISALVYERLLEDENM
jgi:hypothetical protein